MNGNGWTLSVRRRTFCAALAGACALAVSLPGAGRTAEPGWKAGAARAPITPQQFMWMAGYAARNRPAEGKTTELWAGALALEDAAGRRAVLVSLDLIGLDRQLSLDILDTLRRHYDLTAEQVALCCSHTHSGPVVARNLRPMHYLLLDDAQRRLVDQYADFLQQRVDRVVGQALQRLRPARLSWAQGVATFAVNRRNNRAADVPRLRAEGKLQGPVDHDVPVLAVHDAEQRLMAVAFGYACHATTLSFYRWCGDYPGFAQIALVEDHPGVTPLFWAGCGADQNPLPRRSVARAMRYGAELADAVNQTLAGQLAPIAPTLLTRRREVALPLGPLPTEEELQEQARSENRFVASRARMLLEQIRSGRPLSPTYPYPIQVWRLGDQLRWIFLGGEVVVDYSLRLKRELGPDGVWVAGYANDVMAYIASKRVLEEGGYEGATAMVYYGLPAPWAPESEDVIIRGVHSLLAEPAAP